jgi:hypothetical protein
VKRTILLAAGRGRTALPDGSTCLRNFGTGTLDYGFPTSRADIHLVEPGSYTLVGAGALITPTLRGTFQVAPVEGDCVTVPVTTAVFVAHVSLVRFNPPGSNRLLP